MHQSAMYLTMHAMIFTTEQLRQAPERILQPTTESILKNFNTEIHRLEKNQYFMYVKSNFYFFLLQKLIFMSTNQKVSMYPISNQKMLIPGTDQKSGK